MSLKRVLVFGCGWLGTPLAKNLLENGYNVLGTTTSPDKQILLKENGIESTICKVGDEGLSSKTLLDFNPSILIITYPLGARNMTGDEYLSHVNWIKSFLNLPNLSQVILTSSTSVYPDGYGEVNESCIYRPDGAGLRQLEYEEGLRSVFKHKLTILRLAGLIGEGRNPAHFLAGKTNLPSGNSPVNLVHQLDVVSFIGHVIEQGKTNEIYNVCGDEHPSRKHYYSKIAIQFGDTPPTFSRICSTQSKIVSNTKGKISVGFRYKYKL